MRSGKGTPRLRIRTQLTLAMAAASLITAVVGYGGFAILGVWQIYQLKQRVPPEMLAAEQQIIEGKAVAPDLVRRMKATQVELQADIDRQDNVAIIVFSLLSATAGIVGGVWLSRRFTVPLEAVADAARRVAEGDLEARVTVAPATDDETAQLVRDFNRMAQALSDTAAELDDSTAAIAHELRTPLTILMGRLQGMIDGIFPATPTELATLVGHVEALARLVDDLRTVSLTRTGALELRTRDLDMAAELRPFLAGLADDLSREGILLEVNLWPAPVSADPTRMRQAALALIDNARRYGREGGVIRVETATTSQGAALRVLDRGAGIDPEDLEHVFDRFWRAESARTSERVGSGLGLSVVKAIAVLHGGSVRAENRVGGGAAFEMIFPVAGPRS